MRHYLEKASENKAFEIRQFCAFSIKIGHYMTYTTVFKNDIGKNKQNSQLKHVKATIVTGSSDLCRMIIDMVFVSYYFVVLNHRSSALSVIMIS